MAQVVPVCIAGIREPVDRDRRLTGVKGLPDPKTQLVVGDGTPEHGLAVHDRLSLYAGGRHGAVSPAAAAAVVTARVIGVGAVRGRGSVQAAVRV